MNTVIEIVCGTEVYRHTDKDSDQIMIKDKRVSFLDSDSFKNECDERSNHFLSWWWGV